MEDVIRGMPKAELHVHLEGTLEPEHIFKLAKRNQIELKYQTPEEIVAAYDFHDLPSFLEIYYAAMDVLRETADFYELAYQYFERAAADNIVYVEPFLDPQAHTARGISFDTIITGIRKAQDDAEAHLGVRSNLIMCFLRDLSAESAMEHLEMSLPYQGWIAGVGLDSDEKDNPPSKFADVFKKAREEGYKLTMHCDVNQKDIHDHIRECLDLIQVDRIDHGVNCLQEEALVKDIVDREIGLTVCPVSNRFVVQSLASTEIKTMLDRGIKATINSDDPAYFRAYLTDNFLALADEGDFSTAEMLQLSRNAFEIAWLSDSDRTQYLQQLDDFAAQV